MKLRKMLKNSGAKKIVSLALLFIAGIFAFATVVVFANDMADNDGMYYSDYSSLDEVEAAAAEFNVSIGEEGFILMKNDGLLPFEGINNISILGKNSINLAYGGGGSGSGDSSVALTIYDSLEAAGYNCNPKMADFYETSSGSRYVGGMGGGTSAIGETPIEEYDRSVTDTFLTYNDAAIIVITRTGSEGSDNATNNVDDNDDPTAHYLELNQDELDLIALAEENFDNIVVVINNSSPLELGVLEDDPAIDAIVWIGHPGNTGIMALGEILNGSVNPSGRTVDIYSADFTQDPTYQNFGNNSQTDSTVEVLASDGSSLEALAGGIALFRSNVVNAIFYEEGIYMGYRYYETAAYEYAATDPTWYEDSVVYPFGYGLSYTTFDWEILSTSIADGSVLGENDVIEIDVKVTNTGDVAGKDVVELYYTAPYYTGEIEKSYVVLGGFAKTNIIKPGQSDIVTLTLYVQDMSSYDYTDANSNGFIGYELDEGAYQVKLMKNSHDVVETLNYTIPASGYQYSTDRITGNTVENRFTDDETYNSLPDAADGFNMTIMSRADFAGTFPVSPTIDEMTLDAGSTFDEDIHYVFSLDDITASDPFYKDATDAVGYSQVPEDVADETRVLTYMLQDLVGLDKDDPAWDVLINELKYSELKALVGNARYYTVALDIIGKTYDPQNDGPAGFASSFYWPSETTIAATWNTDMAQIMGQMVGNEALWQNYSGWYAPAINIHRSPFSGRNFEYYSEDAFLAGKMASAAATGAQSKGLVVYLKHFALNDQETNRKGVVTFADEQTMREVYLKAFQIPVEEGNALGVMSSFNYIGLKSAAQNYALLTEVLRDEWGFEGVVVTDMYSSSQYYMEINDEMIAGNDNPLGNAVSSILGEWDETLGCLVYYPDDDPATTDVDESLTPVPTYTLWLAVRSAAKNMLYTVANSSAMNNLVSFDGLGGDLDGLNQYVAGASSLFPDGFDFGTNSFDVNIVDGTLPAGLSIDAAGNLSGTATEAGTFTFTVEFAVYDWVISDPITYTITVEDAFTFAGDALDQANINTALSTTISSAVFAANPDYETTHEGYGSVTYSCEDNSLPTGLTITEAGVISGTPTVSGDFTANITVTYTYYTVSIFGGMNSQATVVIPVTISVAPAPYVVPDVTPGLATGDSITAVSQSVSLPALVNGAQVFWTSSDESVVTNAGVVTRPAADTTVTLTATVIDGDIVSTVAFDLTVLASTALTAADIQTMIDNLDTLTETEIQTLIDNLDLLTETQVQELIDASVLSEADVQDLIDASIEAEDAQTGCGSEAAIVPNFGILATSILFGGLFIVLRRKF